MSKKLTINQWINIKTQKCSNPQCPTGQMFSTQVRARYYQLVFSTDKCCFNCNGYHTEHDRRRKVFQFDSTNKQVKQSIELRPEYLIDFSNALNKKYAKNANDNNKDQGKQQLFENSCHNLIEYLFHPLNYKTKNCPFVNQNTKIKSSSNSRDCVYAYCPFLHKDQTLDQQLQKFLVEQRSKFNTSTKVASNGSDPISDQKKFQDKILNIMLLRSCKSIDDLYTKEMNMLKRQNQVASISSSANIEASQSNPHQFPAQDRAQIQKIKQKLMSKASQCLKIDKQRQSQQQSRKVVDKNFSKDKQNKAATKSKPIQQIENDILGISYNYFKYGQKLQLIQGRTVQFKHFKDISDPNHIPLIMRYIAAFLNTEGGKLYIGIDDNSYAYGSKFTQTEYDKLLLKIDNEGKFYMTPPLMPQKYNIKLIPVYHDRKGQERWVIEITVFPPKEKNKKLFLYNRQCYMRMNASTHKLNASDIIELISLNSQNQGQVKQQALSPLIEVQENKLERFTNEKNPIEALKKQVSSLPRQNQLMSQTSVVPETSSGSKQKFQTEECKIKQFEQKLKKKSIEDLYLLRKDYEQRLQIIMETYKKKEREVR